MFKKIFKGIKKVAKKIGKGIKKVVNKVGRAFGKLGIVGQLGMMFLMPYAMNGLSSLWNATGGKAFAQFATKGLTEGATTFASRLVEQGGIKASIGKAMGAIHSAGTAIGSAYTSVSEAISNGFDRAGNFLKGEGFTLSEGRTPVFGTSADEIVTEKATETVSSSALEEYTKRKGISLDKVGKEFNAADVLGIDPVDVVVDKDKSLLQKGTEFASKSWEEFKSEITDPKQYGKKGAQTILAHAQSAAMPDMPVQTINHVSPLSIGAIDSFRNDGVFNTTDFTRITNAFQEEGSVFGGLNAVAQPHLLQQASMGDTNYVNNMRRLQGYGGGI